MELEANDLHEYGDLDCEDETENAVDEERDIDGLDSGFNRTIDQSQIMTDGTGRPLLQNEINEDSELNELSGADGMMGAASTKDYAELSSDMNDIYASDNCKSKAKNGTIRASILNLCV